MLSLAYICVICPSCRRFDRQAVPRGVPGGRQSGQQERDQNRDDPDHHQKLHQREAVKIATLSIGHRFLRRRVDNIGMIPSIPSRAVPGSGVAVYCSWIFSLLPTPATSSRVKLSCEIGSAPLAVDAVKPEVSKAKGALTLVPRRLVLEGKPVTPSDSFAPPPETLPMTQVYCVP